MFELGKQFYFDAAHTLQRELSSEGSRRIHGHTYRAEVTIRGERPDPKSGMVVDLELLAQAVEQIRCKLDHRLLDEIEGLGPATVENLCQFIWRELWPVLPQLTKVAIYRDSTADWCIYHGNTH